MDAQQQVVNLIVAQLRDLPCIEGVFLAGSLVNADRDAFSDVDLGIACGDSAGDVERAYALADSILALIGTPLHVIERGWDHCRLVAALYGKSRFPPVGLEVDLVFSQLQHVAEQMPYTDYEIVFDRSGGLQRALETMAREKPQAEVVEDLRQHLRGMPFLAHDALKAHARGDFFNYQSLLEALRHSLFALAAARHKESLFGTKRAFRHLSASEREAVEDSYRTFSRESVERLAALILDGLAALPREYGAEIEDEVARLRAALRDLL